MRKKWLYFFIVFFLIIAVLYVWRYKQSQVFENRVPSNATKVVNVNLRQIENHLLFDFLANPITYLKSRKKKDSIKKLRTSLTKGVSVPKNILFYTNSYELKNNWFSSVVELNDKKELSDFLLEENFEESKIDDVTFYTKTNFVLAIKNELLIIGLKAITKSNINPLLISLFATDDFLNTDASLLKSLINSESDISFITDDDNLDANFKNGICELQGMLSSDMFIAKENYVPEEAGVILFSGSINKGNPVFKQFLTNKKNKFIEFTHLSLDSIVGKWSGKFNLNISSIAQKTDTIISYEYDDDFNKVAIKSTQKKNIPTLSLLLGQEKTSILSDYFYSKNAIQVVENDTVFTMFPIFKLLASDTEEDFELTVGEKKITLNRPLKSLKLNFYFNAEKYLENPLDIPLKENQEKFLKLLNTINLKWAADNQFSLIINLKDESRNCLGQLIRP